MDLFYHKITHKTKYLLKTYKKIAKLLQQNNITYGDMDFLLGHLISNVSKIYLQEIEQNGEIVRRTIYKKGDNKPIKVKDITNGTLTSLLRRMEEISNVDENSWQYRLKKKTAFYYCCMIAIIYYPIVKIRRNFSEKKENKIDKDK